jgi:DNA-binding transcriptional LysR family regulator
MIAPSLPGLYQRWPGLRIDINASDRMVDMARDGIDIAIRTGTPNSDTVIARQIGTHGRALYAAPAYLAAHGTPQHPDDLRHHRLITNSANPALNVWARTSAVAGKPAPAPWLAQGTTRADNTALQMVLAVQGVGIARLHDLMALPLVRAGALVPLLQDFFENPRVPMYAVTLPNRQRLPKIRACVDYWAEQLAELEVVSP